MSCGKTGAAAFVLDRLDDVVGQDSLLWRIPEPAVSFEAAFIAMGASLVGIDAIGVLVT